MKTKVGVIGCGYFGRLHASKYATLPNAELVGVADPLMGRANEVAEECGCKGFTDYRRLFKKVNAVSVVVPTYYHYVICKDALQHGLHALVEKPITKTVKKARLLIDLAKRRNLILQVGHIERFNPAMDRIRKAHAAENRTPFTQTIIQRYAKPTDRGKDVSVVLDLMIHDIDIVLSLERNGLLCVNPLGGIEQTENHASACLVFNDGNVAYLFASRVAELNERNVTIGSRRPISLVHKNRDPLNDELYSFINCIQTKKDPRVTGLDGLRALAIAVNLESQMGL